MSAIFADDRYQLQGMGSDGQTQTLKGLPINGVMLQRYKNGTINQREVLANYGTTLKNKTLQSHQSDDN